MQTILSRDAVLALAPDAASAKSATGLVADAKWPLLGADDEACWGECQGSGSKPYQVQVDLRELTSRCSCPSRKFPCKHGLALLLLRASGNPRMAGAPRPPWVDEWLGARKQRAEKKEQAAVAKATQDPETAAAATAKREAARWKKIETGCTELQRWLADQFRQGLARSGSDQRRDWQGMAARLVDAQAPGLATRLELAIGLLARGAPAQEALLQALGLLQLAAEGVQRRAQLSPTRLADLRATLGWPQDKDDVLANGEAIQATWAVLGQRVLDLDGNLSERRVWLQSLEDHRLALLQEFAHGTRGFERGWVTGDRCTATLRFFPGTVPLRAIVQDVAPASLPPLDALMTGPAGSLDAACHAFAQNPWLQQIALVLDAAIPQFDADASRWRLQLEEGVFPLQMGDDDGWRLMAFSGGHPLRVLAEWDGFALQVLSARDAHGSRWALEQGG